MCLQYKNIFHIIFAIAILQNQDGSAPGVIVLGINITSLDGGEVSSGSGERLLYPYNTCKYENKPAQLWIMRCKVLSMSLLLILKLYMSLLLILKLYIYYTIQCHYITIMLSEQGSSMK